jgi:hypothetical protein
MSKLWWRRAAIVFAWSVIVFSARPAQAVQPLRPQIARCIPKISADSATQGAGNVSSTRQTNVEFRWALGDPADQASAEIAQTNRVEVCWTSQSEGGVARCPGQSNDAWVIYRSSPPKGQLPQPQDVANPATNLAAGGTVFTLPLDWDSMADRNKILFIVVNGTVQDGTNLLSGLNVNLTAGGLCGMPTRVEPGNPGAITAPAEHFAVYGTPDDFPLPSGWTSKYAGVCDPDAVTACPVTSQCYYSVHATLGACVERAAVSFWRGLMPKASEWQRDRIQAGFPFGDRLDPWPNGTGVSISPDPGWAGNEVEVWVEKKKGKPRVRVFTVDTSGVAKLHKQCVLGSPNVADECLESAAYKGKVRVPVKVDASVHEILVVVSGGSDPSSFTWQLGPQASELTIISPTTASPALIGSPGPFGDERAFMLMFTARDSAGKPYDVVTSANLDVLIDGTSITANCPNSPQNPAPCPFTLLGMSGGSYMAVVQVPSSFYPPQPWPQTVDLEIRLKNGSSSQADLEPDALRVDTAGENLNTMFVIDTSGSMGSSGKLAAAKKAAKLIVDAHIDNVDAAGLVMFSSHAQALNALVWLDPASRQSLKNGIDSLVFAGATAIGDGLYEAQDQLASSTFGTNPVPAVFVLSDGLSMCDWNAHTYYFEDKTADGAPDPNDPACAPGTVPVLPPWNPQGGAGNFANQILGFKPRLAASLPTPLITGVGVGPDADMEALGSLAAISGGVSFHVPSVAPVQTLSLDLGDAFRTAINAVSGHERVSTARVTGLAALPTVLVEPGTRELLISVMTSAPDPNLVELLLLDPQSGAVPPERIDPDAHAIFRVANPQPGLWSFAPVGSSSVEIYMEHAIRTRLRLFARADVEGGMPILSEPAPGQAFDDGRWVGKPLLIQATAHEGAPIPGAMVNALVTRPDGTTQALPLVDDGLHHDGEAGDGLFGALFTNTVLAGTYQIRVVADGTSPASGAPFHREKSSSVRLWDADDADGDLMPTWWETLYGTNPNVPDGWMDADQDGASNATEFLFNGRPDVSDTDGGGESDRTEIEQGRNPADPADDAIATPSLAVFPGNNTLIVRTGLTSNRVASVEVQAALTGPRGGGQMVTFYNDVIPEAGEVILSAANELLHCVRARVSVSGVQSGWSPEVCVTPRLDPEPPAAELSLSPRSACVDTASASVHIEAFEGNPDLRQRLYSDGRASFDPGAIASGVAEMRVAVDSNVDDAPWQPFDSDFTVSLGAAPFVNVGVRVRDAYGNVSDLEVMRIERCPAP